MELLKNQREGSGNKHRKHTISESTLKILHARL